MRTSFNHVGIVTPDFDVVRSVFGEILGCETSDVMPMPALGIEFMWAKMGDVELEFIRSASPDSEAAQLVEAGRAGAHHVALGVPDLDEAISALGAKGLSTIGPPTPGVRGGRIAFLAPTHTGGLLVELVENS